MLNLLGRTYLTDSIAAAIRARQKVDVYRSYMADCLMAICNGLPGGHVERRYYDILHPAAEDNRSGMEIAEERLARYGIKVVD